MFTEKFDNSDSDKDKYNITEKFMTVKKANLFSLLLLLPIYAAGIAVYLLWRDYANIFATVFKWTFLLEIFILAFGVFLFLGLAIIVKSILLSVFAEGGFDSVKFKIITDTQKPYCCLTEPVKVRQYQLCLAAYILIIGVAPYVISVLIGDFIVVLASFVCAYFAASDILMLIFLFGANRSSYVMDFESIMFYRIYEIKDIKQIGENHGK
ncbi:MAG: hypothetical protein FWD23_18280 [Oscillospiraceae bacterium]|nr:hypothetical protein [Oscillospiraceae bacterium]